MHILFLIFSFIMFVMAIIQSRYLFLSSNKINGMLDTYINSLDEPIEDKHKSLKNQSLFSLFFSLVYIIISAIMVSQNWYTYFAGILATVNLARHFYVKSLFLTDVNKKSLAISILHPLNIAFSLIFIIQYFS
ncbi:hypothetical protein D3C71_1714470 [compost metagenome]